MDKLLVSSYDEKKIPYYSRTDGQTDRGKTVYPPPPSGSGGIMTVIERNPLIVYYLEGFCFHNWLNYFR
jgi:hypothetical protein